MILFILKLFVVTLGAGLATISLIGVGAGVGIVLNDLREDIKLISLMVKDNLNLGTASFILIFFCFITNLAGTFYLYVLLLHIIFLFGYLRGFVNPRFRIFQVLFLLTTAYTFSFMLSTLFFNNYLNIDAQPRFENDDIKVLKMGFGDIVSFKKTTPKVVLSESSYFQDFKGRYPMRSHLIDPSESSYKTFGYIEKLPTSIKSVLIERYLEGRPQSLSTDLIALKNLTFNKQGAFITDYSTMTNLLNTRLAHPILASDYLNDAFFHNVVKLIIYPEDLFWIHSTAFGARNKEALLIYAALLEQFPSNIEDIEQTLRFSSISRYDMEVVLDQKRFKVELFSPVSSESERSISNLKDKLEKYEYENDVILIINNGNNTGLDLFLQKNDVINALSKFQGQLIIATPKNIHILLEHFGIRNIDPDFFIFKNKSYFPIDKNPYGRHTTCDINYFYKQIKK